jgi:hypothetical protein
MVEFLVFVRFRKNKSRLQVSLVETRRVDGKVRHEHIAQLGSIEMSQGIADRVAFWHRLHQRLSELANRINDAERGKILDSIHRRVPMPMLAEMQALKIENAEAEERAWSNIHALHEGQVDDHKGLAATVARAIASGSEAMTKAAVRSADARDRAARLRKGEDAPGSLGKPPTFDQQLLQAGFTKEQLRAALQLNEVCEVLGFDAVMKTFHAERERSERRALRALHRAVMTSLPVKREAP